MSYFTARDKNSLYEAYCSVKPTKNLLIESMPPTELGGGWDEKKIKKLNPAKEFDPSNPAYYLRKMHGKTPEGKVSYKHFFETPEHQRKAVILLANEVKKYLSSLANKTFPGEFWSGADFMKHKNCFRYKIAEIIFKTLNGAVPMIECGYAARALQNFMIEHELIKDERNGSAKRVTKGAPVFDAESFFKEKLSEAGTSEESEESEESAHAPEPGDRQESELNQ